jgi:probable HAF family extracellular repeat protein
MVMQPKGIERRTLLFILSELTQSPAKKNIMGLLERKATMIGKLLKLYFIILGLLISAASAAHTYTFASIDVPGAIATDPQGLNDSGSIVGYYTDTASQTHGFLYAEASFTPIDVPGASHTWARGINNSGNIVGYYTDATGKTQGFLFSGGHFTLVNYPAAAATFAQGINNSGSIVGYYTDAANRTYGFLYSGGQFSTINFLGASGTYAYGINDSGDIVGSYVDSVGFSTGFLYSEGGSTTIVFPSSGSTVYNTWATGIDSLGNIVGNYTDAGGYHGFLFAGRSFSTINYPGTTKTAVNGINNLGEILGYYLSGGSDHGFLATPEVALFVITPIDYAAASATYPAGMNNAGVIAGSYDDAAGSIPRGFVDIGGTFTPIDFPGATGGTKVHGINGSGSIVGSYVNAATVTYGFIKTGGNFTLVNYPGATATYTYGINDSGNIAGFYIDASANHSHHGFLNAGGNFTLIQYPGGFETEAHGISNSGSIVGSYVTATGTVHGFLYTGGNFTPIDVPGAGHTWAYGINNSGDIVGYYTDATNRTNGFFYAAGIFTKIDVLGASATYPMGINDSGKIVGHYTSGTSTRGFLAIPRLSPLITISTSPASIDFGNVGIGQSSDRIITITNQANSAGALTGNVGPPAAPFSIVSGGGAFILNPGQSMPVTVRFSPSAAGAAPGNLSITHNATNEPSPSNISLSGTGVAPGIHISINPGSVVFGNTTAGQSSDRMITITNQANSTGALVGNVSIPSAPFSVVSGGGGFSLNPAQSISVTVRFSPTAVGAASGNLPIMHNATTEPSPSNVSLSGTGVTPAGPNLAIVFISGPTLAKPGDRILVQNTVANQGTQTANKTNLTFYLSSDTQIDAGDAPIGKRSVPSLAPGASSGPVSTTATIPRNLPPGPYFIGAIVEHSTNYDPNGITICPSPSKPTLLSPKNRAKGISTTPPLTWSTVSGASSYEAQVGTDSGFTNIVASTKGLTSSQWTVAAPLSGGTTYFWRARAVNPCGAGSWSATWNFKTVSGKAGGIERP